MKLRVILGTFALFLIVVGAGAGVFLWKRHTQQAAAASQVHFEPAQAVTLAPASTRPFQRSVTAIGTVLALQSVTLRNEVPGTVHASHLVAGSIVEAGALLVELDVSVENAELAAQKAEVAVAEQNLERLQRALAERAASAMEADRAKANHEVALAQIARIEAVIARKTIKAPFRARVGLVDLHRGQYLNEGTLLATLQGVEDRVHVDFSVAQTVLAQLQVGAQVEVSATEGKAASTAEIVAIDARIDPATRNGMARALVAEAGSHLLPGASARVRVPYGTPRDVVVAPVDALRRGPTGDHVFIVTPDAQQKLRAHVRPVAGGTILGDVVVIHHGLEPGEVVAAKGSFKLTEGMLVMPAAPASQPASQPASHPQSQQTPANGSAPHAQPTEAATERSK